MVRRECSAITKQSGGRADHGQVSAVLKRSSQAGALAMVRRARSAITKQSSGCASHGQACAQRYNKALERVCLPWSSVRAVLKRRRRAGVLTMETRARSASSRASVLPMVRRARSAIKKQSSACASHGQACAQCYNKAVKGLRLPCSGVCAVLKRSSRAGALTMVRRARSEEVERVCFPWSGVRAVLSRSSRAGVLPMVRRARSAFTKQSSGCASHGQACVQCYNEAVGRVCLPWSRVRATPG